MHMAWASPVVVAFKAVGAGLARELRSRPRLSHALMLLVVAAVTCTTQADGIFLWRERVPPSIPYQRALIMHRNNVETLILQSRYQAPPGSTSESLGWVVPVPAVPELASMGAASAQSLFRDLSLQTRPSVTRVSVVLTIVLYICSACAGFLLIALPAATHDIRRLARFKPRWPRLTVLSGAALLMCTFTCFLLPALSKGTDSTGVETITTKSVGIYDVSVIRSQNASALIAWLNEHSFQFTAKDEAAFDASIKKGWCFVVAVVRAQSSPNTNASLSEGLANPLILRFPHDAPVYPLALTGTGGFDTEVLIYMIADHAMTAGDVLPLRYARSQDQSVPSALLNANCIDPPTFFDQDETTALFKNATICKFKGTLTPAQMSQDLVFQQAASDEPYREHLVIW